MKNPFVAVSAVLAVGATDVVFHSIRADGVVQINIRTRKNQDVAFNMVAGEIIPICGIRVNTVTGVAHLLVSE